MSSQRLTSQACCWDEMHVICIPQYLTQNPIQVLVFILHCFFLSGKRTCVYICLGSQHQLQHTVEMALKFTSK